MLEVVYKSNDALDGYSVYTASLEKKLKIHSKKNDSERKKKSLQYQGAIRLRSLSYCEKSQTVTQKWP